MYRTERVSQGVGWKRGAWGNVLRPDDGRPEVPRSGTWALALREEGTMEDFPGGLYHAELHKRFETSNMLV